MRRGLELRTLANYRPAAVMAMLLLAAGAGTVTQIAAAAPKAPAATPVPTPKPPPSAPPMVRLAIVGDSLAQQYGAGLGRLIANNPCLKANIDLGRYAKPATGLTRSDYFDWQAEIKRVTTTFRPTITFVSFGMNDRQTIIDPGNVRTYHNQPAWPDKYGERVKQFIASAQAGKAIVIWAGLPVMRERVFNADMQAENKVYVDTITKLNIATVRYVEPWRLNPTGPDVYVSHTTVDKGRTVQLRSSDGMHFANYGEDLLAAYVMPKIIAALAEAGFKVDQCPAAAAQAEVPK